MILPNLRWTHVAYVVTWFILLSWSDIYNQELVPKDGWGAIVNVFSDKAIYMLAAAGLGLDKLKLSDNKGEEKQ